MKKLLYRIVPLLLVIFMTQSCKKDSVGFTKVTVYPVVTMNGDDVILVEKGGSFNDPGADATSNGVDISDDVKIKTNLDLAVAGKYTVTYYVVNEDGFSVEKSRTVYVYDGTASALESKVYTVAVGSNRNGSVNYSGYSVVVYQLSPGVFSISDFLGGYYQYRAGYGPAYAAVGTFRLNGDNTMSLLTSYVSGWGDELDGLDNGVLNTNSGRLSFSSLYAGQFSFNVILE